MTEEITAKTSGDGVPRRSLIILLAAVVLAGGAMGYRVLSGDPAEVEETAVTEGPPTLESLRAAAEKAPLNAGAWQELGFAYFESNMFDDAVRAYRQAIEGDDTNAVLWSSLGEARLMASDSDPMPSIALTAFEKAIALDPTDARARYFLAVKKDLDGDHQGAIDDWAALLEDTPPGAPWTENLQQTIVQVGKINKIAVERIISEAMEGRPAPPQLTAGNAIPGPSAEQIAAAGAITPTDQRTMAEGMVESLDKKLRANPNNPDGWVMLMRSRMTLGQPDQASQALKDALAANPGDAERLQREAAVLAVPQ